MVAWPLPFRAARLALGATFLALLDMDVSALERTQKQLQAEFPGARLAHWVCNVSDEPTVREVFTQVTRGGRTAT